MSTSVRAVKYYAYNDIRLEQGPLPTIGDHELLVRVHGCGLCGSDILKIVQQAPPPVVLGHELSGEIVERGKAVSSFSVGQRVIVAHHAPCGTCHYCRHQNYSMCATFKASNIDPGGFAEYIRVPATLVEQTTLALPPSLDAEAASFVEPLACCLRAVKRTPLLAGDTVVVVGLGSIGLLMIQAVRAITEGQTQVYGIDLLPERLQLARELGATQVFEAPPDEQGLRTLLNPLTDGRGADAVILTVPGARPFNQAFASVRKGGTIQIFAAHTGAVPLNIETIYQQELSILSTYSSSPVELQQALGYLAAGQVRVKSLISHRLPLEDFHEGVRLMQTHKALKVFFYTTGEIHGKYTL